MLLFLRLFPCSFSFSLVSPFLLLLIMKNQPNANTHTQTNSSAYRYASRVSNKWIFGWNATTVFINTIRFSVLYYIYFFIFLWFTVLFATFFSFSFEYLFSFGRCSCCSCSCRCTFIRFVRARHSITCCFMHFLSSLSLPHSLLESTPSAVFFSTACDHFSLHSSALSRSVHLHYRIQCTYAWWQRVRA